MKDFGNVIKWLKSPEGQESIDKFFDEEKRKDDINNRWKSKIGGHLSSLSDSEFDSFMDRLLKREERYRNYWYYVRRTETNSSVFDLVFEIVSEIGVDLTETEEDQTFLASSYHYRGYDFKIFIGNFISSL